MIDHVSIAVRDLKAAARFYEPLLATLGMSKLRDWPDAAIGYGKKHPEFWINARAGMARVAEDSGVHICLRATSREAVEAFHAEAVVGGGTSDGAPGFRAQYHAKYYATFVRDPDGNRLEAVTFIQNK
jgi:catechol 2,3-dioxygenase-like lactoylglutathione lyase family enzyme